MSSFLSCLAGTVPYNYSGITYVVCAYFIYVKSEIMLMLLGMKTFSIGGKKMIKKSHRS